jgi:hypothetical protein
MIRLRREEGNTGRGPSYCKYGRKEFRHSDVLVVFLL